MEAAFPRIFHDNMSKFLTHVSPLAQQAEILAHGAVASKIKKQKSRQMKELRLELPEGMTVNNSHFNGEAEENHTLEVTIDVRKCPSDATRNGRRIEQKHYFGHLSVVVDGTLQSMELFDDKKKSNQDVSCDLLYDDLDVEDEEEEGEEVNN
jgi:hypothetical protein